MIKKTFDGSIEVITGPMFSGKSEELIKIITTLSYAEIKTLVIKPSIDNRFSSNKIVSRNGKEIDSFACKNTNDIKNIWNKNYKAIVIDEVQFFDEPIIDFIVNLANNGIKVIVSGLDMDFKMKPFGVMPQIFAVADEVVKLKAVCIICKRSANTSYRKTKDIDTILLGDSEYEARCRECHFKKRK